MSIAWLAAGAGRPPRLINGISLQRLRSAQLSIIQADNFPGGGDGLRCINTSTLPLVTRDPNKGSRRVREDLQSHTMY